MKKQLITVLVTVGLIAAAVVGYQQYVTHSPEPASATALSEELIVEEGQREQVKADNDGDYPINVDVPVDKEWIFSFSKPLDEQTLSEEVAYVLDEQEQSVPVKLEMTNNNKTIHIIPPEENYQKGAYYQLHITKNLGYEDGETVKAAYRMDFVTKRDKVEKGVYRSDLVKVAGNQVFAVNGESLELDQAIKEDLQKGDILVLPDEENPEGRAVKVETVESKRGSYLVTISTPEFAELFEQLDIYQTYAFTLDDIEMVDGLEGVSLQPIAQNNPDVMVAAANTEEMKEFELPGVKVDATDGFAFQLNDFQIGSGKKKVSLDGSIKFHDPKVKTDVLVKGLQLHNFAILNQSHVEQNFKVSVPVKKDEETFTKPVKLSERVPLASGAIPTAIPGVFVEAKIYLALTYAYSAEPEVTVEFEFDDEKGVIYDGKTVKAINNFDDVMTVSFQGKGTGEAKAGAAANVAISALKVIGAGVEGVGGLKAEGAAVAGMNEELGTYKCAEFSYGPFVGGNAFVDVVEYHLFKKNEVNRLAEVTLAKDNFPVTDSAGDCSVFTELAVSEKEVALKMGETAEIAVAGMYYDLMEETDSRKELKAFEQALTVTSSNEDIVSVQKAKNKIILSVPEQPVGDHTTIELGYEEDNKLSEKSAGAVSLTIPVTISDYQERLDWAGTWTRVSQSNGAKLMISNQKRSSFDFDLNAASGGNTGNISGTAQIDGKTAVFTDSETECRLVFSFKEDAIAVEDENSCSLYGGMGVFFAGDYEKGDIDPPAPGLVEKQILTESQDAKFRQLTGDVYEDFTANMQLIYEDTDNDGLGTTVSTGGVRGLYSIMEAIIMHNEQGDFYAATLTNSGEKLVYFTNNKAYENELPETIEAWRSSFSDVPVEFVYKPK